MTINTSSFFMQTNKPYLVPYSIVLSFISIFSVVIFFQHKLTVEEDIHPAIITYFLIKAFLIFANWVQPFKYFKYNPIIYKAIINLTIGLILAFLYLKLYQVDTLIFIDCGLSLISVFSLMKMHQNKNARQNIV